MLFCLLIRIEQQRGSKPLGIIITDRLETMSEQILRKRDGRQSNMNATKATMKPSLSPTIPSLNVKTKHCPLSE